MVKHRDKVSGITMQHSCNLLSSIYTVHSNQEPKPSSSHSIVYALAFANDRTLDMLAPIEFLVQTLQHKTQDRGGDNRHDGGANVEAHCEDVLWLDSTSQQERERRIQ